MDCQMLDLVGGSGTKPITPGMEPQVAYDDIPFTDEELVAFSEMPAGSLADHYYSLIDLTPSGRSQKAVQLRQVIRQRGLSCEALSEAWDQLHAHERAEDWRR